MYYPISACEFVGSILFDLAGREECVRAMYIRNGELVIIKKNRTNILYPTIFDRAEICKRRAFG